MTDAIAPLPAAPTRRIRLGVLGTGWIFSSAHLPAYRALRAAGWPVDLVAAYDRDPARLAQAVASEPGLRAARDIDDLVAGIDALLVLLPSNVTAAVVGDLSGRVGAILAEKPVADDVAAIERCAAVATRAGCRVQVAFNRPHQALAPAFLAQARADATHHLAIRFARVRRGEPMFYSDVLGHPLSLLHHGFGPLTIDQVHVDRAPGDALPRGVLVAGRAGAMTFALDMRPAVGRMVEEYLAYGDRASSRLVFQFDHVAADPTGLWRLHDGGIEARHVAAPGADHVLLAGFTHQLASFVRLAAGDLAAPSCSLGDAAAIQVAIRTAMATIDERRSASA